MFYLQNTNIDYRRVCNFCDDNVKPLLYRRRNGPRISQRIISWLGANKNLNNNAQFFHYRDDKHEPWFDIGMVLIFYEFFLFM